MKLPLENGQRHFALPSTQAALKRGFDIVAALALSPIILPATLVLILCARISTGQGGLFAQNRVGLYGEPFTLYKIRSMKSITGVVTTVTTSADPRITPFGRFIRRTKLDEFPQLWNVLRGDMSFVGPRPDVPETYAELPETDSPLLCIRPGITGPATVLFRNEEEELRAAADPEAHNREVIFPAKVAANIAYAKNWNFARDIGILLRTVLR
jgi:lipopolysaccharide/colanic/teichoic acid biosynthesis glycosyltransferase